MKPDNISMWAISLGLVMNVDVKEWIAKTGWNPIERIVRGGWEIAPCTKFKDAWWGGPNVLDCLVDDGWCFDGCACQVLIMSIVFFE
jgi:hypothetical protein